MTVSTLLREFGSHRVAPEDIFPELEWESFGPLGKELVQIFKDLTVPETWVAIHDNGNFAACHNSIRGNWKEDPSCKVVLVAGVHDTLMSIGGFCWLGFFTEEEWASEVNRTVTELKEAREKDYEAVKEGRMPERDPVIGVQLCTGLKRDRHDNGFRTQLVNSRFREVLTQIRDRLEAAGYSS